MRRKCWVCADQYLMAGVALHLKLLMDLAQLGIRDILDDLLEFAPEDLLKLVIIVVAKVIVVVG